MIPYVYRAAVLSVHDGDTVALEVDLGFYVTVRQSCRVLGINAAELGTEHGATARDFLRRLLPVGTPVEVTSVKADKYGGRFDGILRLADGRVVAEVMIAAHQALPWDGKGPRPVP